MNLIIEYLQIPKCGSNPLSSLQSILVIRSVGWCQNTQPSTYTVTLVTIYINE